MDRENALATMVGLMLCCFASLAEAAWFFPLDDLELNGDSCTASDISADGSTIVGHCSGEAFRWNEVEGIVGLRADDSPGISDAVSASSDGAVVVGDSYGSAFLWTEIEGIRRVVDLIDPPPPSSPKALGISDDGETFVGYVQPGLGQYLMFRWQRVTGDLSVGNVSAANMAMRDVSADGSTVVGWYDSAWKAFYWKTGDSLVPIGFVPGDQFSQAHGVSSDGSVIVGMSQGSGSGTQAFRWTSSTGMVGLGHLPNDGGWTEAFAVSADGSVIVGRTGNGTAFIWDATNGMRDLTQAISELGVDMGTWQLVTADAISSDGQTILGTGHWVDIWGAQHDGPWVAYIPEPNATALGLAAFSSVGALRRLRKNVGPGMGES